MNIFLWLSFHFFLLINMRNESKTNIWYKQEHPVRNIPWVYQ